MSGIVRGIALAAVLVAPLLALAPGAGAATLDRFLEEVDAAYDATRTAMFYLQRGGDTVAAVELEDALSIWRGKVMAYAGDPPGAFAEDAAFAERLVGIEQRIAQAVSAASPDAALAAISAVPEDLRRLRADNRITTFADVVHEANLAMDSLWEYRDRDFDLARRETADDLRARVAVAHYTYTKCKTAAPPDAAASPAFGRLVDGTLTSLDKMWGLIAAGDRQGVINILREVRAFDRLLWLEHG